jgi:hypothetical protein
VSKPTFPKIRMTQQLKKPLDQVRACPELVEGMQYGSRAIVGQCKHCAYSTERSYVYWVKRLDLYHNKRHPVEIGEKEISESDGPRQPTMTRIAGWRNDSEPKSSLYSSRWARIQSST